MSLKTLAMIPGALPHLSRLCLLIGLGLFSVSCSESLTPEQEISQFIEQGKQAAEQRSHSDLSELVHKTYRDHKGYDKARIKQILRAYFFRHQHIHLLTRIDEISIQSEKRAFVSLYVAMAGTQIINTENLGQLRAQVFRFELQLIKDNDWQLQQAKWERARVSDML